MTPAALALAALPAWPWLVFPALVWWRARDSRALDDDPPPDARTLPSLAVVVPARDEARNIERCLRALLAADVPRLAIVVVDDHSTDGTGDIARRVAAADPRVAVVDAPPLPPGWFGKQWACATGAAHGAGAVLCFVDADTTAAPDLLPRAAAALDHRGADLLSVVGRQELGSFWERAVMPLVLAVLAGRYGGTEQVSRARRPADVIANGQCLLVRRTAYDRVGGHAAVRDSVSEDLVLAKRVRATGGGVVLLLAPRQLSTRMYTSLRELVGGWSKNWYAGGREGAPGGAVGRLLFPLMLFFPPLLALAPPVLVALDLAGLAPAGTSAWAPLALALSLAWAALLYHRAGAGARWAFSYPLGAAVMLWIVVRALARGRRVRWKGRDYTSR